MSYDATNVTLGVCDVYLNGTHMGLTMGGVEATYSPEYHESKVDQYSGMIEKYLIGEKWSAKVPLAEFTLANINKAIGESTLSGGKVTLGSKAGKRASAHAAQLVLHPIANSAGDRSEDVVIWKAVSTGELVIGMKNDGEKILECTFEGLVDESRTDGSLLGLIGDSAA